MRNFRTTIGVGVAGLLACGGVLAACQSYHFQEVTPEAIGAIKDPTVIKGVLKPAKIMLVLDKSGSMATHPDDDNWGCCTGGIDGQSMVGGTCNYDPTGDCKWNTLKNLLVNDVGYNKGSFFDQTKGNARFGLAIFPALSAGVNGSDSCADGKILVPVGPGDNVDAIKTQLSDTSNVFPMGGTPTAHMLQAVQSDSNFADAETNTPRYVILITDGQPNCNSLLNGNSCQCTSADPLQCIANAENCLDDSATVKQVDALYETQQDKTTKVGIKTFVIGFGSDASAGSGAAAVLNAAAVAGHTDQQLNPNANPPITTKYYQATSAAELTAVLQQIIAQLQPCTFTLTQKPDSAPLLEVSLTDSNPDNPFDGNCQNLCGTDCCLNTPADWSYTDPTTLTAVKINDPWCKALQNATPDRYTLNFLSVHVLQ
jgi:hypothetical protein